MKSRGQRLYPRCLVVVESPGNAEALQAVLGKEFQVEATLGHFREIETFDVETGRVSWRVETGRESMIASMAALLGDVDELVLATDDDREGDAIAWHLVEALRERVALDGVVISRMVFYEITDEALLDAYEARTAWSHSLRAEAAVVRAIVDKAIGEVMSVEVSKRLKESGARRGYGLGRVRAALLRLVAEHDEKLRIEPRETFSVRLRAGRGDKLVTFWPTESDALDATGAIFRSQQEAEEVATTVRRQGKDIDVALHTKGFWLGPATPAGTAEVLIAAYEEFGLAPIDTYRILQDLYEGHERAVQVREPGSAPDGGSA